jgi:alkaline phosphatase D
VISWLQLSEVKRPHLIFLYFHEPDETGHKYGPDSEEIKSRIKEIDELTGYLFKRLRSLDISDKVNVIITSDHGMGTISNEKSVYLSDYIKNEWVDNIIGGNPVYNIWAKNLFVDSVQYALSKISNISFWKNTDGNNDLNYGSNTRTGSFTVLADSSWSIHEKNGNFSYSKGTHGYDNRNKDMHACFFAIGTDFKSNYNAGILKNVDIYPLIAQILGLKTDKIDGKSERILHVLK